MGQELQEVCRACLAPLPPRGELLGSAPQQRAQGFSAVLALRQLGSVTVTVGARFRGGGKSMECCLAALPFRETSHERAARFEMAPYLARSSSDPKSSPFNKTVLPPVILRTILSQGKKVSYVLEII